MHEVQLKQSLEGVDAVVGWDIDGILNPVAFYEKWMDGLHPSIIPNIQLIFQRPDWRLLPPRVLVGTSFLAFRTNSFSGIRALVESYRLKTWLGQNHGIVVKNMVFTERPALARPFFYGNLWWGLKILQARGVVEKGIQTSDLVEGYFHNPYRGDFRQVKPTAAKIITESGVDFHLNEDKLFSAKAVVDSAPDAYVHLLTTFDDPRIFGLPERIIPAFSKLEQVDQEYAQIMQQHLQSGL